MTPKPVDLDELERLERSATKGEWKVGALLSSGGRAVRSDECATSILTTCTELNSKADAALIVALRNAAPAMIQELRRLRVWQEASEKELRLLVAERDSLRAEAEGLKAQLATAHDALRLFEEGRKLFVDGLDDRAQDRFEQAADAIKTTKGGGT